MRPILIFVTVGIFFTLSSTSVEAAGLVPCGNPGEPECQACHIVELGQNVLTWLISISASIIAIIFAWAGMKIVMAKGSTENMSEAKGMMTNSIIGLVILLSAWLVIDTVLKLVITDNPEIKQRLGMWNEVQCVAMKPMGDTGAPPPTTTPSGECSIPPLSPITDPAAQKMEAGQTVIWKEGTALQACVNKFIGKVGGSVTSAYRPQSYQTHLWEIRDRWCTRGLQSNTNPGCSALRTVVSGEVSKHFGASWNCGAVAETASSHGSGLGVDIQGIAHGSPAVLKAAQESCLTWPNYSGDPVHYNLVSGCSCQ